MVCPHPQNKELVAFFEKELDEKRVLTKHKYRLLNKDFDYEGNWTG